MGQAAAGGSRCFDRCNTWSGSTIRGRSIDSLGMAVADAQLLRRLCPNEQSSVCLPTIMRHDAGRATNFVY